MPRTKIHDLIRQALDLPENFDLADDMTPVQIPGWDSFGWLNIILTIEKEMGIEFSFEDLEAIYSLGQLCDLVEKTGADSPENALSPQS